MPDTRSRNAESCSNNITIKRRYTPFQVVFGGIGVFFLLSGLFWSQPDFASNLRAMGKGFLYVSIPFMLIGYLSGVIFIMCRTPLSKILPTLIGFTLKCIAFMPTFFLAMILFILAKGLAIDQFALLGPVCATNKKHYTLFKDGKKYPYKKES